MHDFTDEERLKILGEAFFDELRVIHEYVSDIPALKADVIDIKETLVEHTTDLEWLKKDVSLLKNDVSWLKKDVSLLKNDVSQLKMDVSWLKLKVA